MKRIKTFVILTTILVANLLSSCSDTVTVNQIVGTWSLISMESYSESGRLIDTEEYANGDTYIFKENGDFVIVWSNGNTYEGKYELASSPKGTEFVSDEWDGIYSIVKLVGSKKLQITTYYIGEYVVYTYKKQGV